MQNFFATCLALGILGGGFVLTGDLGRLAARGLRVIQATDVPDDDAPIPVAANPAMVAAPVPTAGEPRASAHSRPPRGLDRVDISTLAPGTRITVWLATAAHAASHGTQPLTFDIVDPLAGETLASEVQPSDPGQPAVAPSPPRRAVVRGSGAAGEIVRGGLLELETRGIAGAGGRETVGTVVALEVQR